MKVVSRERESTESEDSALGVAKIISEDLKQLQLLQNKPKPETEERWAEERWALCANSENGLTIKIETLQKKDRVVVCINDDEFRGQVIKSLRRGRKEFTDWGMFLHIPTTFDSNFPELKTVGQRNGRAVYYDSGMVQLVETTLEQKQALNRQFYALLFERNEPLVSIAAVPGKKWVDDVQIIPGFFYLTCAITKSNKKFPFRDCIAREIETEWKMDLDSEDAERIHRNFAAECNRLERLKEQYASREKLPDWQMTNPKQFNPKEFRLLVHAENGTSFSIFNSEKEKTSEYTTDPLKHPEVLEKRAYISCSLVDEMHTATFGSSGFVLDVPKENIRRVASHDIRSVIRKDSKHDYDMHLPSAQAVINTTKPRIWNEVVVAGTNERTGSKIRINGAFATIDPLTMKPSFEESAEVVKMFAAERNLSLVRLVEPFAKHSPIPAWAAD